MTPAEIAAKLKPAQIRAMRDPEGCHITEEWALIDFEAAHLEIDALYKVGKPNRITDLGRAVLAALDAKEAGNG